MKSIVDTTVLIDDSEIDLFIQRRFLEVYSFTNNLIAYKSAQEAIDSLSSKTNNPAPDIIFLDLNMPNIDGFGFLESFDKMDETVKAKSQIVVLTSSNNKHDKDQAFQYKNVIQYITKPIKQSDIDQLKKLLGKS
ncbi:MAG TPA: response regulator [Cyclobacteriaceae bacterium]|nr:response regulator [Cyclobacteriaceae bacterium]HRJ82378.1 response regulator [Cyclobacteriaceae bacterium]